jgi:hypothetical protein
MSILMVQYLWHRCHFLNRSTEDLRESIPEGLRRDNTYRSNHPCTLAFRFIECYLDGFSCCEEEQDTWAWEHTTPESKRWASLVS